MFVGLILDMGPVYTVKPWYTVGIFLLSLQLVGGVFIFFTKLTYLSFTEISESASSQKLIIGTK
mgnify:CR=1 FL=1